jgi:hypothetical protein
MTLVIAENVNKTFTDSPLFFGLDIFVVVWLCIAVII